MEGENTQTGDKKTTKTQKPADTKKADDTKKVTETKKNFDLTGGKKFKAIPVMDSQGSEHFVSIKFQNTTSDNESSDHKVSSNLVEAVEGAVKEAVCQDECIQEIKITATTNGKHGTSSRHYVENGAKGIDIGGINGKSVKSIGDSGAVKALQTAFEHQSGARENFGPSMMKKSGKEYINDSLSKKLKAKRETVKSQHKDHLHWSVN